MEKTTIQPSNPHFFKPIMPGSLQEISIPKAFMRNYLVGEKCQGKATLRSNKSSKSWTVGIKGFCLKDGWEDFATQHDLRIGDILVFKHQGGLVFHVIVFDSSSCEKQYPPLDASTGPKNIKKLKTVKMKKKGSPGTVLVRPPPEDPPQFTVTLQASYFEYSSFPIPMDFARENGLIAKCGESKKGSVPIILEDPKEKTWNAFLKYKPSNDSVYIRKGWPEFSSANNFKVGDVCTFELVSWWSKNIVLRASICKS
ncbi:hypothetical protein ACHQM5_022896 [Ranunculus cassubicifolius]